MKKIGPTSDKVYVPIKYIILEKALKAIIDIYSIQTINDLLAKIYWELSWNEYESDKKNLYDKLSESYDNINNSIFVSMRKEKIFKE